LAHQEFDSNYHHETNPPVEDKGNSIQAQSPRRGKTGKRFGPPAFDGPEMRYYRKEGREPAMESQKRICFLC
jgi:hypothetical protein